MSGAKSRFLVRHRAEEGVTLVEVLVAMSLTAIIGFSVLTVVMSTSRTSSYTNDLRTVMDDGRISVGRIRKEIRAARQVMSGSNETVLNFWVDQDQDNNQTDPEMISYCVRPVGDTNCIDPAVGPGSATKFELVRWTAADSGPGAGRVAAKTLLNWEPFTYDAADPIDSRVLSFSLELDVDVARGPQSLTVGTNVRLRNVD